MRSLTRCCALLAVLFAVWVCMQFLPGTPMNAQVAAFGTCKPVSERTSEMGCWILVDQPVGRVEQGQIFWHLDVYRSRVDAQKAKGPRGTVVESLGKVWLLTIENSGWRPAVKVEPIAEIGPLPVIAGEKYSAVYMEAILNPGMSSAIHMHSGPEAWYTLTGETCLETPTGKMVGSAGSVPVIVPGGTADVADSNGKRTASCSDAHIARIVETANDNGARLDTERVVPSAIDGRSRSRTGY